MMGNRFWLENQSGTPRSVTFSAGGSASPVLPQTATQHTRLENTLAGSGGALELSFDGQTATVLENVDTGLMTTPEDLRAALIVGAPRTSPPTPISGDRGIPFTSEVETARLGDFLPSGVSEANTDIDLVMCLQAAEDPHAITAQGLYDVDTLSEDQAAWVLKSLLINTITNSADGARVTLADVRRSFDVRTLSQMRAALNELIWEGKFYIKPISSWGGRFAIIFKGRTGGRAFLTAAMYGLRNRSMQFVSSYADIAASVQSGNTGAGAASAARGVVKGNLIGFIVAGVVEVSEFMQSEDPEKNWGDLLGGLSVAFVKVWVAGFVGTLAAAAVVSAAAAGLIASAPVVLVVGVGVGVAIAVGFALDGLDQWLGVSDAARRIGRSLGTMVTRAVEATAAFVERIVMRPIDDMLDQWMRDFREHLRRHDPVGHCALFCTNPLDQLRAWEIGLGGG